MKKILFFIPHLNGGGAERVTINIINQLNKISYDIFLVCLDKNGPLLNLISNKVTIIQLNSNKTMFSFFELRKTIKKIQPNILFSSLSRSNIALYISLLGFKNKPKVILRCPNSPKLLLERGELSLIMKMLLDITYINADVVIAQTPEMKIEISEIHKIPNVRIQVLLNPIDKNLINKKIQNIKNPFNNNFINVVAAGRIIEQKGFDILIKSFKDVIKTNTKFKLYIIGEDVIGEKQNLEKLIEKYSLQNHIEFLGFQTNPYKYFYFSDLYVLSSRWEGLPNTVLENLYLEKPIISTKCIPFMETIIQNGKNGLLVEVENVKQLSIAIINYKDIQPNKFNLLNSDLENIFNQRSLNEFN